MNAPRTYYEWVSSFDYIKDKPRNDLYLDTLNKGSIEGDNNLKMKLVKELADVINYRLERAVTSFNEYLTSGELDYNGLSLQIVTVRKEFVYAKKLINIHIVPKEVIPVLEESVQKRADRLQEVLVKQTVYADRSGVLNSLIKSNPINRLEEV